MLNVFYKAIWNGEDLDIFNIYSGNKPMYSLRRISDKALINELINGENIDHNQPILAKLYEEGVIIEKNKVDLYRNLNSLFYDLGADIDKLFLSRVLTRDFFKARFNFFNIDPKDIGLEGLLVCNETKKPLYIHNIIGYSDTKDLEEIKDKINLSNNSTVFLCKVKDKKIEEIGPIYKSDEDFCFQCLKLNMEKQHKIIKARSQDSSLKEIIFKEYIGALVDYYSWYITMLSSVNERKIIFKDNMMYHTELIAPISLSCQCMQDN
ncbi:hypothetical protein [Clostridium manihotivorum]|uniref:Uncharacterized protein n=1 Tax=Clostridium manihotivorum TaxID=2320868 RepID=A0A3R5TDU3_9CLOT|nr:hypothetical protein [Clostridium manihotivorum]QAA31121.1 hypothetical protein C1I91_05270 [Clostridium manihotivorum]